MIFIYFAIFLGGTAALTWEVIWLHFSALAIGVSAQAAAIVFSVMMSGIALGSYVFGPRLQSIQKGKSIWLLAVLEILIGLAGLFLAAGFRFLERLDTWIFQISPDFVLVVQCIGIIILLGVPSFFMGMTVPVYSRLAREFQVSLARIYAINVAGAACGILLASFFMIPLFGIQKTIQFTTGINVFVAIVLFMAGRMDKIRKRTHREENAIASSPEAFSFSKALFVVFVTGFSTFTLEVVWFRSLRASLQATTESFALVLFVTLIALAIGSHISVVLKRSGRVPLSVLLALGGFLIFQTTPVIERIDLVSNILSGPYEVYMLKRLILVLVTLGPPMCALGIGLPWLLETYQKSDKVGILYAVNTLGAVVGSLTAGWLLLSTIGFVKGAWLAGGVLIVASLLLAKRDQWVFCIILGLTGFLIAVAFKSDVGSLRVQGVPASQTYTVLASHEGPDSTTAVIENVNQVRQLIIDGYSASDDGNAAHYMEWMGRLPMILHPAPKNTLVICFGTGQTANGVRLEGPGRLDIVDVNQAVFKMADLFNKNQNVLGDPRTHATVMDGRAYLRRINRTYDVVTLEPMPPTFAGSNALYSLEFYQLILSRLNNQGVAAQWLPFHLVSPDEASSIVATFDQVFPHSVLWIDPVSATGIILGVKSEQGTAFSLEWHGLKRTEISRSLSDKIIQTQVLKEDIFENFVKQGRLITDDNQLLSYGYGRMRWWGQPREK